MTITWSQSIVGSQSVVAEIKRLEPTYHFHALPRNQFVPDQLVMAAARCCGALPFVSGSRSRACSCHYVAAEPRFRWRSRVRSSLPVIARSLSPIS